MAFKAEDGTGLSDANAYITVTFADGHHSDRGRTQWASALEAVRKTAIIRATDYIDQRFGTLFIGEKMKGSQGLEWPRADAFDRDGHVLDPIPPQLQKACAEYALIALRQGELAPQPPMPVPPQGVDGTIGDAAPAGEIVREKIGPIETEYRTLSEAVGGMSPEDFYLPKYPVADMWLEELLVAEIGGKLSRG